MSPVSTPELLVIHAVRVLGYAPTPRVAARTGLTESAVKAVLARAQSAGHLRWSQFADQGGWSLTEAGKAYGEHLLATELDTTGSREVVQDVLEQFEPLNELVTNACTEWQLTELGMTQTPIDLDQVLSDLTRAATGLEALEARLRQTLARFAGYHQRLWTAVHHARHDPAWVNGTDRDSAHRTWFELHEDLLATLGRSR